MSILNRSFSYLRRSCFDGLYIDGVLIESIVEQCAIVGGFAGASSQQTKDKLIELFVQYGFVKKNIFLMSDLEISSSFIEDNGIVLIAGTGSVAFGRSHGKEMQVGGLGRHLGDEGSGYHLGLQAIKACLEYEYGYGKYTILVDDVRSCFQVSNLKEIIRPFYVGDIPPKKIAGLAPIIFEKERMDFVAAELINAAANNLGRLVSTLIEKLQMPSSTIYLIGGIFKNKNVTSFLQKIKKNAGLEHWTIVNIAHKNPTTQMVKVAISDER